MRTACNIITGLKESHSDITHGPNITGQRTKRMHANMREIKRRCLLMLAINEDVATQECNE